MDLLAPAARPESPPASAPRIAHWRALRTDCRERLREAFFAKSEPSQLLRGLARLTDTIVAGVFAEAGVPPGAALVAVGGYGRGMLYPHSDVDILILLAEAADRACADAVE